MRLDRAFRYALYAAFAVVFVTGAVWLVADNLKDSASEFWQEAAATLLMCHGGGAMITLMMLGALVPVHMRYGWRSSKNLVTGITVATVNAALIVTAFGLYYLGSEAVRPWISWIHIAAGFFLALMLPLHILLGRRARAFTQTAR